jgi:Ca2+/H+ antiporter
MERMFGRPIITQEQMRNRIRELGRQISTDYAGKDLVLLALSVVVCTLTLGTGRTSLMQGAVHLVIFAAFVFLALVP